MSAASPIPAEPSHMTKTRPTCQECYFQRHGLCALALVKATLVGWFFMHLGHETKPLKLTVAIPMCVPAFYAFVLIAEAAWRLL